MAGFTAGSSWNNCGSWPLSWFQVFEPWSKTPGRIQTWTHSSGILKISKFWGQCGLVAIGDGCRDLREGPRSETNNLESGLAVPRFDQWVALEKVPPLNLLDEPNYSLMRVWKWNPADSSPPCAKSCFHRLLLLHLFLVLCFPRACALDRKGKATGFWPPPISILLNIQELIITTQLFPWTKIQIHVFFWWWWKSGTKRKRPLYCRQVYRL